MQNIACYKVSSGLSETSKQTWTEEILAETEQKQSQFAKYIKI